MNCRFHTRNCLLEDSVDPALRLQFVLPNRLSPHLFYPTLYSEPSANSVPASVSISKHAPKHPLATDCQWAATRYVCRGKDWITNCSIVATSAVSSCCLVWDNRKESSSNSLETKRILHEIQKFPFVRRSTNIQDLSLILNLATLLAQL